MILAATFMVYCSHFGQVAGIPDPRIPDFPLRITDRNNFNFVAEFGWGEEVLLIEQGELGGGTSTHATGLMGVLKPSDLETRISLISRDLYRCWFEKVHLVIKILKDEYNQGF